MIYIYEPRIFEGGFYGEGATRSLPRLIHLQRFATLASAERSFYGYEWQRRRGRTIDVGGSGQFLVELHGDEWKTIASRKSVKPFSEAEQRAASRDRAKKRRRRDPDSDTRTSAEQRADLKRFADAALSRAERAPARYQFGRKTFIAALEPSRATKRLLIKAHRAGFLELTRADLTQAFDRRMLDDSEVVYMNATWHFVSPPRGSSRDVRRRMRRTTPLRSARF